MVLAAVGHDAANRPARWLASLQTAQGSVGVFTDQPEPRWPTALAVMAWRQYDRLAKRPHYGPPAARGLKALLSMEGHTVPKDANLGHDTSLVGWPWVAGTHSWVEPTAFAVLALKASGQQAHARTREAVTLLVDRQLPNGGWNYGNTFVLGQQLRAHVLPTALALLALRDEPVPATLDRGHAFLRRAWPQVTGTSSECCAAMVLGSTPAAPANLRARLERAFQRTIANGGSPHRLALLGLASLGRRSPLVSGIQSEVAA